MQGQCVSLRAQDTTWRMAVLRTRFTHCVCVCAHACVSFHGRVARALVGGAPGVCVSCVHMCGAQVCLHILVPVPLRHGSGQLASV